ncbi:MAG: class I SAM-dependent methyltransferase [Pseudomonadaceae bacterium]|nr:class I SAM-dependent methyltransferase [Pseudomonadaceae bacterium]
MTIRRIGSWQISISRCLLPPGQLASRYDVIAADWERTAMRYQLEKAYQQPLFASGAPDSLENISGERHVLDCGVGSGSLSIALQKLLAERVNWYGIDTSSEMLSAAEAVTRRAGLTIILKQANVLSIPYADESFDMVMAAHVLEHLPQPERGLEEMVRVLKPGGRLFICMTRPSLFGVLIQMRWRTWAVTEAQGLTWLRGCQLSDIGLCRMNLGWLAGSGSTAFWAKRPT